MKSSVMSLRCRSLALAAGCSLAALAASAATLTTTITNSPVWDAGGAYTLDLATDNGSGSLAIVLDQGAGGKLSGTGDGAFTVVDASGEFDYTVDSVAAVGTIKSTGGSAIVDLRLRLKGTVTGPDRTSRFNGDVHIHAAVDPATQALVGVADGHLNGSGHNERIHRQDVDVPLPQAQDGDWQLDITYDQLNRRVAVSQATVSFESGSTLSFDGHGTANAKTGEITFVLLGPPRPARGPQSARLTLRVDTDGNITRLDGSLLGQKVR